ncbi:DNA-processing protein DprA [Oceanobacillus kapialis]|uniref:DNA-processing protein DprA n=1 Tax=Oceanobacillus kapialis TaxID=481353 RepID=A0ABW5PZR8_9BACI
MPIFLKENDKEKYICYFTLYELLNRSFKKVKPYFYELQNYDNWEEIIPQMLIVDPKDVKKNKEKVIKNLSLLRDYDIICKKGSKFYPERLNTINDSPEFLFMRGEPLLADKAVISIVGSRAASEEGSLKARVLSRILSERGIVVASGLAKGIDINAHQGTIDAKKQTIAVIGTPLNKTYPKEHNNMQDYIGEEGLVISQFPPGTPVQRWNFPMRNAIMSGISIATIVMEAGETSGALIQARESLKQGREVFIPQSAIDNPSLSWPKNYVNNKGAKKFTTVKDLFNILKNGKLITTYLPSEETKTLAFEEKD